MRENTTSNFADQQFWTGVRSSAPVTYNFHLTGPNDAPLGEPHAPIIHAAADEPDLSDDELDEFEARLEREERQRAADASIQTARQRITSALRSAEALSDYEGLGSISRDLTAALASLDQMEGGRANV